MSSFVLSIVLMPGISFVPAIYLGVYGQQEQQQQQLQQQNKVGLSQVIKQIAQRVASADAFLYRYFHTY
jgi:hypothetical protein